MKIKLMNYTIFLSMYSITIFSSRVTGIAIPTGLTALVYCDGTNVLEGLTSVAGNLAVGGNLTVTGTTTFNGGTVTLGDANTDNIVFGVNVRHKAIAEKNTFISVNGNIVERENDEKNARTKK